MQFLAGPMVGMNAGTGLGMNMNMNMNMNMGGATGPGGPGPGTGGTGGMGGMDLTGNIFSPEFMQGVANALDDIDPSLFRPDGDLNFERDFGQWFSQDESLDLK
jgi:collagen type III alpha